MDPANQAERLGIISTGEFAAWASTQFAFLVSEFGFERMTDTKAALEARYGTDIDNEVSQQLQGDLSHYSLNYRKQGTYIFINYEWEQNISLYIKVEEAGLLEEIRTLLRWLGAPMIDSRLTTLPEPPYRNYTKDYVTVTARVLREYFPRVLMGETEEAWRLRLLNPKK